MLVARVARCLPRVALVRPLTSIAPTLSGSSAKLEKIVDEIAQLNLMEVSEFVKILKTRLDIPDMMATPMMMAGGPAVPAAAAEEMPAVAEKTSFTIKLTGFDAVNKVKTIKEVRAITKLGLKEAKALVESAPCDVLKDVNKADAEAIMQQLKDAGAQVELV